MPDAARADEPAKQAFGKQALPADARPQSVGFYSRGCMAGAVAIPVDGPDWQVMRLSRNRRWGHPELIRTIEKLASKAKADGWNGLMVGDISQPRGGPMLTGHASHQIGLDADLWFMPMPDRRLSYQEREELSAVSVLKTGSNYVDDRRWTKAHEKLLKHAAAFGDVERILVHPGVKKKLCDTVKGDRAWLAKVRPFYGHHYHFHIRLGCQDGSPACKKQAAVAKGEGCDASLDWWFKVALAPKKPKKDEDPEKPPRPLMVSQLPADCVNILKAPEKPAQEALYRIANRNFTAPPVEIPPYDPARALASRPIESKGPVTTTAASATAADVALTAAPPAPPADGSTGSIPVPTRRPAN
ncbi:MAG TPA: penicillin-insensitive murein endopeptidase [Rhizobiaceae bacterium]|nr:penicillin-insensitive murein endopeptidase [Rhizobiaceae bacterium]